MPAKKNKKKKVNVRDMKPAKDAKGGLRPLMAPTQSKLGGKNEANH